MAKGCIVKVFKDLWTYLFTTTDRQGTLRATYITAHYKGMTNSNAAHPLWHLFVQVVTPGLIHLIVIM